MCGIAGYFNWQSGAKVDRGVLEQMARALRHRGPDGQGFHMDGALGLAHRRLAIIDIEGGQQPMSTPEGDLWIAYNGEVYNYIELLDDLSARGHRARTRSDTEAVLLAYREWGLRFPEHLNGMFAVAIWDARLRRLVLCRDRMGIKPLYYAETVGGLVFGSEIKALRAVPGIANEIDHEALDEYMTCGYVTHPRSIVRGVHKVDPGTLLTVEPARGVTRHRYWSLRFEPDHAPGAEAWSEEIRSLFTDSVRLRLRSDVPVGTLLSGGVDSTVIAGTMARLLGPSRAVDSFCVGVDMPGGVNEFDWASSVAGQLGLRHHELRMSVADFGNALAEASRLIDEPLMEPMIAQLLAVCRLARQHVTVLLSGEGSDETWFGYSAYRVMYAIELAQKLIPGPLRRGLVPALDRVAGHVPMSPRMAKYLRLMAEPLERRYLGLNYFDTAVKDLVYAPDLRRALAGHDARETMRRLYDGAGGPEPLSRMAAVDCRAWLVDNTLLRSDLMSMASSLELRVPFLDHRLVELATRIPARFKVLPHHQKVILKQALADRLPRAVARRKKVGFPTPLAALLRSDWGLEAEETISSPGAATAELFDRARLRRMLAEHRAGKSDWSRILFQVIMLEHWAGNLAAAPGRAEPADYAVHTVHAAAAGHAGHTGHAGHAGHAEHGDHASQHVHA